MLSEDTVRTNGVGPASGGGAPVAVVGAAHWHEIFDEASCAGAPFQHPVSGRVEGVVSLTCRADAHNPLQLPLRGPAVLLERRLLFPRPLSERHLPRGVPRRRATGRRGRCWPSARALVLAMLVAVRPARVRRLEGVSARRDRPRRTARGRADFVHAARPQRRLAPLVAAVARTPVVVWGEHGGQQDAPARPRRHGRRAADRTRPVARRHAVEIPPLRTRPEDIAPIAAALSAQRLRPEALQLLERLPWPRRRPRARGRAARPHVGDRRRRPPGRSARPGRWCRRPDLQRLEAGRSRAGWVRWEQA